MARYPDAVWRPTGSLANDPQIQPVGLIEHVAATEASSLFGYFNGPSGGIESHFFTQYDGDNEQYRDTTNEADANYRGNSWVKDGKRYGYISHEHQGLGSGEWTGAQILEIKELIVWLDLMHPSFRPEKATSVYSGGVGYHTQFGAGPGTVSWSNARGKVCPGKLRIEQMEDIIFPWLNSGGSQKASLRSPSKSPGLPRGRSGLLEGQVYGPDGGDRESWKDGHESKGVGGAVTALSNFLMVKGLLSTGTSLYTAAMMAAMAKYFAVANSQAGKKVYRQDGAVGDAEWNYIVRAVSRL